MPVEQAAIAASWWQPAAVKMAVGELERLKTLDTPRRRGRGLGLLVEAAIVAGLLGDVAVGGAGRGLGAADFDNAADRDPLTGRLGHLGIVDPSVRTVDDEVQPAGQFVARQPLAHHPADGRWLCIQAPMDHIALGIAREALSGHRPVHGLDDIAALAGHHKRLKSTQFGSSWLEPHCQISDRRSVVRW